MVWYNKALSRNLAAKLNPQKVTPSTISSRGLCHKSKLPAKDVYRWPYERIPYNLFTMWYDLRTKKKFDENTKIIQIEGNVASGKEKFARQLADELGMAYFPQVDLEDLYINEHGYDYRALNPLLPERLRHCDMAMFHENPSRHSVVHMQYNLFRMRLFQYMTACRHMFNTGQGVILTRSPFTDLVFVEAMNNVGWLPRGYLRADGVRFYDWKLRYNHQRNYVLHNLKKPHLTIFLDTPIDTCLERIKNDPDPMIANSNALTREFLEAIESAYKDVVLPKQQLNMNVLRYDYPEHRTRPEIRDVVDDIEELDFEYDHHDTRFEDWEPNHAFWYTYNRRVFTSKKFVEPLEWLYQPYFDIAGLGDCITDADLKLRKSLYFNHIGDLGYNRDYRTDMRLHNPIKVLFDIPTFGQFCERQLRLDYL